MPHRRRMIVSNTCYEVCFRARSSLPFVAYRIIKLIIGAAVARAQRDDKVVICHDIWNGSHPHLILVAKDSLKFVQFYDEVQKKITDMLKRLLGLDYLSIWEGYPAVIELGDPDMVKDRIAYLYANPAQDNLVESIDQFPGYSSWEGFLSSKDRLSAMTEEEYPWIRLPSLPKLPSSVLTSNQDRNFVRIIEKANKKKHKLVRHPNAWMKCFKVDSDQEVKEINDQIIEMIREREDEARNLRQLANRTVMGRVKLCSQEILKPHTPKKREIKVFIMTTDNELRMRKIEERDLFDELCRECYESWKKGDYRCQWPPGAFKPPLPPTENLLPGW